MTREQLIGFKTKPTAVYAGGAAVFVRVMSAAERFSWLAVVNANKDDAAVNQAALVVRCLCDENGARLFADDETKAALEIEAPILDKIGDAALTANGIGKGSEEVKKNSQTPPSDSSSNSPAT